MPTLLKIRLALKGRPIRSYTFNQPTVTIGRDPECDIAIENTGISRRHARIERTDRGFFVEDLGSSNGTFLNEQPVLRDLLQDEDCLRIGKFAFWVTVDSDRRDRPLLPKNINPDAFEGTTVLSSEQVRLMHRKSQARENEVEFDARSSLEVARERLGAASFLTVLIATLLVGLFLGVSLTLLLSK